MTIYILCVCLLVYVDLTPYWNKRSLSAWVIYFFSVRHSWGLEQGLMQRRHEMHMNESKKKLIIEDMKIYKFIVIFCYFVISPWVKKIYLLPLTTFQSPHPPLQWFYATGIKICYFTDFFWVTKLHISFSLGYRKRELLLVLWGHFYIKIYVLMYDWL